MEQMNRLRRWKLYPIVYFMECAHFYGTKMTKPIASMQIYGGTVFEQVDMAVSFVMLRIDQRVGERIHSNQVDVTPELPAQAVREAIVNAVVHRDYTSTGSVQVMLFKDRLEILDLGKLPQGMTNDKLRNIHSSCPVNPTLANPVYLTGYIEQMGTGTTDIIELCEKSGLRTPEFHQDEDFLIRIWRPENAGASLSTDHQTAHETDHQTAHEIDHMSEPIKRLIIAIKGDTKTREEIMNIMQLNHRENFRLTYLIPALETGYIAMLYPDNPKRKGQAYYLTQKGLDVLVSLM